MLALLRMFILAVLSVCLSPASAGERARLPEVDVMLVLAVDVSSSITDERWELQRRGYAEAFKDPEIIQAITSNGTGSVAVTLVQWSSTSFQAQAIGWTVIQSRASASAFSERLADMPRMFNGTTSVSAAINYCVKLIDQIRFKYSAARAVIDISGDGSDDDSPYVPTPISPMYKAREAALARGIVINGLPLLYTEPGFDVHNEELIKFYQNQVIGGPGSFIHVVRNPGNYSDLAAAIKRKILREIS